MIFLRPIRETDLDALVHLLGGAHLGITSLPKDRHILEQKIIRSISSFKKETHSPHDELYFFALEDSELQQVIGISAIEATTGGSDPLYFFRQEIIEIESPLPAVTKKINILSPVSYIRGPSEVCSLFLDPSKRGVGTGKLLSLGRFLFIAQFPERFTNSLVAELRGVIENDISPFWEGVGRHFFEVPLEEALELLKYGRSFIPHFLPKHPIYVPLLPDNVQNVIGKTHPHTKAALSLLLQQGFELTDEIDVFDGGPKLKAMKSDIRTVGGSLSCQIIEIKKSDLQGQEILLANERLDFRACLGMALLKEKAQVSITPEVAECLQVGLGDYLRLCPLRTVPYQA